MARAAADAPLDLAAPAEPLAVPLREAARLLGIGVPLVNQLISSGQLRPLRFGQPGKRGRVVIPVTELQGFIRRRLAGQAEAPP